MSFDSLDFIVNTIAWQAALRHCPDDNSRCGCQKWRAWKQALDDMALAPAEPYDLAYDNSLAAKAASIHPPIRGAFQNPDIFLSALGLRNSGVLS